MKKTLRGRRDDWIDEDGPPALAGGLDTERGALEESPRAPRSFFEEAAGRGFLEAVSFYYSPRKPMFRVVISASSSSLRSLPAPGWLFGPVIRPSPLVSFPVLLFLPALVSFFVSRSGHPPGQFLCSPVLARFSRLFCLALRSSPWSVSLFPCSCPPQSAFLALRSGHLCQLASLLLCSGLLQSAFLASSSGHPPSQLLCPPVLAHPMSAFLSIILYIFGS